MGNPRIYHWHKITVLMSICDAICVNVAYMFALLLSYNFEYTAIPKEQIVAVTVAALIYAAVCIAVFGAFRLYRSMWRFASADQLWRVGLASLCASAVYILGLSLFYGRMRTAFFVVGTLLQLFYVSVSRFSYRFYLRMKDMYVKVNAQEPVENVMIIGAGAAGETVLNELHNSAQNRSPVCFIDDNPNKWHRYFGNVPIVGGRHDILKMAEQYKVDTIILAIPSLNTADSRDILNICNETGCKLQILPNLSDILHGTAPSAIRDVAVEDLLGREPIQTNLAEVFDFIREKTILVTGGGGSIGSELCRQIAAHQPKQLILFDVYENTTYEIQLELKKRFPELNLVTLIGSVRDSRRLYQIFQKYHPDVVYHAAAHKHVPLMEDSPCEAIKNNAIGTYKTAFMAAYFGVQRFVLISTDKAVNPTNIMGASKRLCEMIIQSMDAKIKAGETDKIPYLFTHYSEEYDSRKLCIPSDCKTEFVAVRFGNVLGSNGSVIPLFKKQLEQGGPLTVTHPDIVRYFMTIPEAVSLVLLAGTDAAGGEIFVLDMGEQVRIADLAQNLIRLSGKPNIQIEYTGLRPGEKLYEEKLMAEEGLQKTQNEKIFIGKPLPFDVDAFFADLKSVMKLAYDNSDDIRVMVQKLVPTFHHETVNNEIK